MYLAYRLQLSPETGGIVNNFKEFNEEELTQLEEKGISRYHVARFLDSLRNNIELPSFRELLTLEEIQQRDQSLCSFV